MRRGCSSRLWQPPTLWKLGDQQDSWNSGRKASSRCARQIWQRPHYVHQWQSNRAAADRRADPCQLLYASSSTLAAAVISSCSKCPESFVVCCYCRFIFKDQYIEFSTRLPRDSNIYGIGEVSLPSGLQLPRDGTTITLWARDMPSANPYANLYGSHPFYLQLNAGVLGTAPTAWVWGERSASADSL